MTKIKTAIDIVLKWFLVFILALMTINVLWQVFSRFVLQNPSSFTEELARYTLVWLGILGASYVAGQKMHLAIDLLSMQLKGRPKLYLEIFIQLSILFFSLVVMLIGGFRLVLITLSLNQISAALQVPLGYVYLVVPISGLLIIFYSTYFILEAIKKLKEV
ncbi:MAG: TRAP transporter small permease [Melioribacteraceae bacterium]|jgi:TRAP-type C4-dicarboxylate transport system permease small subunit|nr:TRAP transporter small permease [Melioribacteraceae bacterium]